MTSKITECEELPCNHKSVFFYKFDMYNIQSIKDNTYCSYIHCLTNSCIVSSTIFPVGNCHFGCFNLVVYMSFTKSFTPVDHGISDDLFDAKLLKLLDPLSPLIFSPVHNCVYMSKKVFF